MRTSAMLVWPTVASTCVGRSHETGSRSSDGTGSTVAADVCAGSLAGADVAVGGGRVMLDDGVAAVPPKQPASRTAIAEIARYRWSCRMASSAPHFDSKVVGHQTRELCPALRVLP